MENIDAKIIDAEIERTVNNWWIMLLVGALLIAAGFWIFSRRSGESFAGLTALFVFLFVADGVLDGYFAVSNRRVLPSWGGVLFTAAVGILLGLMLLINPPSAASGFTVYIAIWLMNKALRLGWAALDLNLLGFSNAWMWLVFGAMFTVGLGMGIFLLTVTVESVTSMTTAAMIGAGAFFILFGYNLRKAESNTARIERKVEDYQRHPE